MSVATDPHVIAADLAITHADIIRNPQMTLQGDKIVSIKAANTAKQSNRSTETVTVIIPGLINCHVHTNFPRDKKVEFEYGSMVSWVAGAIASRTDRPVKEQQKDVEHSLKLLARSGVTGFAEISNDFVSLELIRHSGLACRYFHEQLGFQQNRRAEANPGFGPSETKQVTLHTAPHAPYSTNPALIKELIASEALSSIHISENQEEVTLLKSGEGRWREYLKSIGRDNPEWIAPQSTPIEYLAALDILSERLLLVHCVHVTEQDIEIISESGASVVLCPTSNEYIGVGTAPVMKLFESGINLTLGTDSLASNTDLNLFAEMRAVKKIAPKIPCTEIWKMATDNAVRALGWTEESPAPGAMQSTGASLVRIGGLSQERLDSISREELLEAIINRGDQHLEPLAPAIVK